MLDLSLSGMGLAEAMEFFENEGISTDPIIAEELAEQFGGHPLALKFVSELSASRIERGLDGGLDAGFIGRSLFGHTPRTNKLIKLVSDMHLIAQQSGAWCPQDIATHTWAGRAHRMAWHVTRVRPQCWRLHHTVCRRRVSPAL